ncbi:MAG TPA: hypothetical protein VF346_04335 [Bacteroidales bacterium]
MAIQIVLIIIILALFGYVIFLHIQLSKRNIFIETTIRRLSGIEKNRSVEEMMSFLQEIQELKQYSSTITDKLLDDSTLKFILENGKNTKSYIHYTQNETDARSIIKNGFQFVESFYKTALPVSKDKLDLKIKHNSRKLFGDYIIVICISNDVANFYSYELGKAAISNYSFENILTETPPVKNNNSDLVYQLASQFIKGFVNHQTGAIVKNPGFDPLYNSPNFLKNIELMKS